MPEKRKNRTGTTIKWLLRNPTRIALLVFISAFLLCSGVATTGYFIYQRTDQDLQPFIQPVSRGQDEPAISSSIAGRTWNILLLGSDNDNKYTFPAILTQVVMVVHVDTLNNTLAMVSIPRDSWVWVPQVNSMHKIDQAFLLGSEQDNTFASGVRLMRSTIEQDYDISIDRYAWVGLDGFAKVINTLGGVDVDVTHPIVDDAYPDDTGSSAQDPYAFTRLYIAPGPQHMNGQQALDYVRTRHADLVGDLGRTERQQQVLSALKQKLNVSSILQNYQQIINDLKGSVYTDLSQDEMIGFANYLRTLSSSNIEHITLGWGSGSQNYGQETTVYDPMLQSDQEVVEPECNNILTVTGRIFGSGFCDVNG